MASLIEAKRSRMGSWSSALSSSRYCKSTLSAYVRTSFGVPSQKVLPGNRYWAKSINFPLRHPKF